MLARSAQQLSQAAQAPLAARKLLARSFGHRVNMVLKQDVPKLGFRGEEVTVKAGYARNFLYPEKLAVYATDANREKFKVDKQSVDEAELEKERALKTIMERLESVEVLFKRHTAARGDQNMHSQVTAQNISDMLEKQHGIIVGVARIDLPTPIKTLGTHTVKVRVDDAIEAEHAAKEAAASPETAAEGAEATEDLKKGPSKKKEVKLTIVVTRR